MRRITLIGLAILMTGLSVRFVWAGYVAQSAPPGAIPTARWSQTSVDEWNTGTLEGLIVTNNAGGEIRLDPDSTSGVYTSAPFVAPFAFTAAAAEWEIDLPATTAVTLEVRTSPNATEWRDWQAMPAGRTISATMQLLGPIGVEAESRWVQYRLSFQTGAQPAAPSVATVEWLLLDSSAGPSLIEQPARTPAQSSQATLTRPPLVITRTGWGAAATAPNLTPSLPRRLELTALPLTINTDPLTILRALQQVAISYGERDLPYAYVVDSSGNVYQGQSGFLAHNGVIRVALLGEPTDAARVAAAQTLAWLAQSNRIPVTLNVAGAISSVQAEEIRAAADAATVRARWTFVESNTRDYTERLMFFNPTRVPAKTVVTFLPGQSNTVQRELTVEPGQRVNFIVNDVFSDTADLPIEVTSNQVIIAERTMLFANDALGEPGIEQFSRTWYFAEGDGSRDRTTTLRLYNPQPTEVAAELLIMPSNGLTRTQSLVLPAFTTTPVELSADLATDFGVRVAASAPIAAERTLLFGPTKGGGFLTRGANAPATTWYFAEGATIAPFSTTLALLNPGPTASAITTTFVTEQGSTFTRRYQIPGYARLTVDLRDIVPSPQGVGTIVTASQPIVAERTTYFNNGLSGTNTLGATSLAYTWRFAEGRTAAPATEFILLVNPNQRPAEVTLTIGKEDGTTQTLSYTVPRTGRLAILLNNEAPDLQSHSTVVDSTLPIIAERSIFIANDGGGGGHSALGTPEK